eukprot:m.38627 g.38627  ORF g.38627 m.38627 type:complete len:167 (-) comp11672_c0_seq2:400-900(-)
MSRKLDEVDESGVDRSYYHGTISREEAVARLQQANVDGTFLLRMSATEKGAYTISLQAHGEIKHIRVNNVGNNKFSLGKSKDEYDSIWDLIEAQLDRSLKSTKGDDAVELVYPLPSKNEAIAPDLLKQAAEVGMDANLFDKDVLDFMTGGVSAAQLAGSRAGRGRP